MRLRLNPSQLIEKINVSIDTGNNFLSFWFFITVIIRNPPRALRSKPISSG